MAEKTAIQKQLTDLQAANSEAASQLKAFRTTKTATWVATVEAAITGFNADVTWYNNAIKQNKTQ